ncbi:hypothetical protein [Paraburkholderia kirstenboschensis]|uniref:Uncharacterized protein n=1 Tax=Paraburkholderia kirstenboschensis TaxID=1245436 RepID=A0ABZ0ECS0_9BURK|nr:hypothetical protein [Paraburkholderia kirstenboschensis]WOD14042.1 hypothetical protein RW095_00455 [Paraburkholderia kirstenboschensis]
MIDSVAGIVVIALGDARGIARTRDHSAGVSVVAVMLVKSSSA